MDFNKLWQNFLDTLTNHYVDFNGRVGRAQFWYYVLVVFAIAIVVYAVSALTIRLLYSLFALAVFLPNLGMTVRRLHDIGKQGLLILIPIVPAVLAVVCIFIFWPLAMLFWLAAVACDILIIYWLAQPGQTGDNQYGPPPPAWTPN